MTGSCVRIASNWSPFILSMSFLILLLPDYRWNDYSTNTQHLFILRPCYVFCNTYCHILFLSHFHKENDKVEFSLFLLNSLDFYMDKSDNFRVEVNKTHMGLLCLYRHSQ